MVIFPYDEYGRLEKYGFLKYVNKVYGHAKSGTEECFIAGLDFADTMTIISAYPSSKNFEELK